MGIRLATLRAAGAPLLHLWLADLSHLWVKVITFMVSITFMEHSWSIFTTFMVGITFAVFITFMGDTAAFK